MGGTTIGLARWYRSTKHAHTIRSAGLRGDRVNTRGEDVCAYLPPRQHIAGIPLFAQAPDDVGPSIIAFLPQEQLVAGILLFALAPRSDVKGPIIKESTAMRLMQLARDSEAALENCSIAR